ncbi:hypothetical protein CHS0354_028896 [Potamilus streckersoni]|uniref:C2H2-type domain-containing protein n=1 Tax=Potamilus streckersoni TaxID=2493646 RepID=A0AAE0SB38_9BIVA|nr:hypothetical protein CHS0354_028896 [Potamilus streckersoni]
MGSAEIGGKIFLTTNVLLKYEKVRISVKKDDNDLMEHFFKLHSKWSKNAITVKEEVAMQYRSLEKAMKMDSTALMEHFLSLFIGDNSTVKEEYPEESLDSLTSLPTQSASLGEASTPPVMEYNNASISQDGSTNASPRNLVQSRDTALCSISSNTAIKNSGALYKDNQGSSIPSVHIPLDSGVSLHQLSGTSSLSHTFSQKRKLSSSSDGDVPASKIPGIQHHVRHLHPSQSSGEPLQQENIPDRRPLIEGTTGHHHFGYQTGSARNEYGKPSATFSLQDVEQQQNQGIRTSASHSDRSKDSSRDISKTTLDFIESVSQVTPVDSVHSLRLSVDRVSMGSTVGSETLERANVLGMNISHQSAKDFRQNRVSMDNSINIHPQPGTSGVNQSFSGSVTEFDLSAVKIEVNSDEDLEDVSRESGDQEALAAMVTDAEVATRLYVADRYYQTYWEHQANPTYRENSDQDESADVTTYPLQESSKSFGNNIYKRLETRTNDGKYQCSLCNNVYKTSSGLREHAMFHTPNNSGTRQFKCSEDGCGKVFTRRNHLLDHLNMHLQVKPFQCAGCNKSFFTRYSLRRHQKFCVIQTSLACSVCKRRFKTRAFLQDHIDAVHVKQKFVCDCGASFLWRPGLAKHRKSCTVYASREDKN